MRFLDILEHNALLFIMEATLQVLKPDQLLYHGIHSSPTAESLNSVGLTVPEHACIGGKVRFTSPF